MKLFKAINWFGRWSKRQIKQFENWLEYKYYECRKDDPNFKMNARKLAAEYPPFKSKIYSHVPGLDETAKTDYFAKTKVIPHLKKLGLEGINRKGYWKQENYSEIQELIADHMKRMKGDLINLEKLVLRQKERGTITERDKMKLLLKLQLIKKKVKKDSK